MKLIDDVLNLSENSYLVISDDQFRELMLESKVIAEKETYISDKIRIISLNDFIFIQETTNKQELLVRRMKNLSKAEDLVTQRLDIYDKMWDGCGCKVDYYS